MCVWGGGGGGRQANRQSQRQRQRDKQTEKESSIVAEQLGECVCVGVGGWGGGCS